LVKEKTASEDFADFANSTPRFYSFAGANFLLHQRAQPGKGNTASTERRGSSFSNPHPTGPDRGTHIDPWG